MKTIGKEFLTPLFNDLFKVPKQNISLSDIAAVYTAMDFRVFDTEGHFEDSQKLNISLKACIDVVHSNTFENKIIEKVYFVKKDIGNSTNYMEPSPCLNLNKFPECSHYCTLHSNLFKDLTRIEFLTIMKYATPQRKIRYIIDQIL